MTVRSPVAAAVQYALLVAGIGAGLWLIIAGVVIEPSAVLMEAIQKANARLLRLVGRPVTA